MLIKRDKIVELNNIFERINNTQFNINTQYKLLKIKKTIEEENEIYIQQLQTLKQFFLKDENGNPIMNQDGGYAIDSSKVEECNKIVNEINAIQIQVPDMYFSLEELEPLQLTFSELEALDPFIKF